MTAQTLMIRNPRSAEPVPRPSPVGYTAFICSDADRQIALRDILQNTPLALAETVPFDQAKWLHLTAPHLHLIIIGFDHYPGSFLETVRDVRKRFPQALIVALADDFDVRFIETAYDEGVRGFCLTTRPPRVLIGYLELIMAGEVVVPPQIFEAVVASAGSRTEGRFAPIGSVHNRDDLKLSKLSTRERQILNCLKEGSSNKMIARKFDLTEATIKVHVKSILRKVGVTNRTQAAMWACQCMRSSSGAMLNV